MIDSVAAFVQAVRRSRLLEPAQLDELRSKLAPEAGDFHVLAEQMIRRGWLTPYQAKEILQGDGRELVLGPCRVLSLLGSGGLSQVFRAWHTSRRQIVALKVLHPEFRSSPDVLDQFHQEMEVLARLSHPCFVKAVDVGRNAPRYYFAMEYVEGIDLLRVVRAAGLLPMAQACKYVMQAAYGLQYAYEQGLVHRDVKPANLVVTFKGDQLHVLDIGLARLEWSLKGNKDQHRAPRPAVHGGAVMGTADYIAPEQALNPQQANIRADIYSLGCTLYQLLTGQPPFPAPTLARKLFDHQRTPPPSVRQARPELPEGLAAIVLKMMAKQPADRYQTPAGVALALAPFCQGDAPWVDLEQFRPPAPTVASLLDEVGGDVAAVSSTPGGQHAAPAPDTSDPRDRRAAPRRAGNPVPVLLQNDKTMEEPLHGWVLNRSTGGVALLVDEKLEIGSVVKVRPDVGHITPTWIPIRVVSCAPERASWRVGCQFISQPTWGELRLFG